MPPISATHGASGSSAMTADVPHLIARRDRIPSARYYDQTFFDLEGERLWPSVWQMADSKFGALQIAHDGDEFMFLFGQPANLGDALGVIGVSAVREI